MTKRSFSRCVATLLFVALCLSAVGRLLAADLPNIVVFISDDLGRLETSVHGSAEVKTPTMDALAATGMTFDNAYVASPSCCPNRFSLLTGLMTARHSAHPNHSQPKPGTKFLMPILQSMGYHLASSERSLMGVLAFKDVTSTHRNHATCMKMLSSTLDDSNIEGPVCLLVGDRRPHVAWTKESIYDPRSVTLPSYFIDTPETREHWARYLTDITGMDEEMGRIYEFARQKFGDNFIFLFTSDHGGQWPRGKWNLYDSGTRVPLIAAWPGHISAGKRTDAMVSWVDIIPTLMDLVGGNVPSNIDGISFADVLLGHKDSHRERIFTTHTGDGRMNIFPIRSVRVGRFKYIHNLRPDAYHTNHSDRLRKDGAGAYWDSWDSAARTDQRAASIIKSYYMRSEFELFDLQSDPLELNNLAGKPEFEKILAQLKAKIAAWTKAQGDELQPHQPPYLTSEPLPNLMPTPKKK